MSATGVWVVGTVSDEELRGLRPSTADRAAASPFPPPSAPAGCAAELDWWRGRAGESLFARSTDGHGEWTATEDARWLCAFFDGCRDGAEPVEDLRDAVMERFPPEDEEGLFAAAARKANPFWALAYALGPEATLRLPGWFGDVLLDSAGLRACLPAAEAALTMTGARRRDAIERIHAWMTGLGDAPDHDADALLDGPLRVLRYAARTGRGVAAFTSWY
ncbi:hypothetical protein ACGF07_07145 [Kitasatospora sp. NPDC048194]|uniref:hypothetical protein n=1 Tax=Kitasatospora sp. NPDC048194 TaxID=3364045 RepID=UPI0037210121